MVASLPELNWFVQAEFEHELENIAIELRDDPEQQEKHFVPMVTWYEEVLMSEVNHLKAQGKFGAPVQKVVPLQAYNNLGLHMFGFAIDIDDLAGILWGRLPEYGKLRVKWSSSIMAQFSSSATSVHIVNWPTLTSPPMAGWKAPSKFLAAVMPLLQERHQYKNDDDVDNPDADSDSDEEMDAAEKAKKKVAGQAEKQTTTLQCEINGIRGVALSATRVFTRWKPGSGVHFRAGCKRQDVSANCAAKECDTSAGPRLMHCGERSSPDGGRTSHGASVALCLRFVGKAMDGQRCPCSKTVIPGDQEASWCGVVWEMDEAWCWSTGAFSAHQRILAGSGSGQKIVRFWTRRQAKGLGGTQINGVCCGLVVVVRVPVDALDRGACVSKFGDIAVLCFFIPVVPAMLREGICGAYTALTVHNFNEEECELDLEEQGDIAMLTTMDDEDLLFITDSKTFKRKIEVIQVANELRNAKPPKKMKKAQKSAACVTTANLCPCRSYCPYRQLHPHFPHCQLHPRCHHAVGPGCASKEEVVDGAACGSRASLTDQRIAAQAGEGPTDGDRGMLYVMPCHIFGAHHVRSDGHAQWVYYRHMGAPSIQYGAAQHQLWDGCPHTHTHDLKKERWAHPPYMEQYGHTQAR
ncbi:hypothetical protein B0H17DRAFT_1148194 [Mycena rosella]|uniref:Uncharacterized protein n=1 Tax=Mycena rosella TaxID=1033263 RepID=A0AAD7CDU8_MYCRO|nr:hypothetical protein B0H17DRAFT_1148194 [Mycena rosella]